MEPELKEIHFGRSLVFQDMAIVEISMNRLISLHFLNNPLDDSFIKQMLQHPYFSFELRKRIFKMIFKEKYPEIKFSWRDLEEMQKLRNIIAHGRIDKILENNREKFYYCYHSEKEECATLHGNFKECMEKIVSSLNEIKEDTQIVYNPEPPLKL